MPGYNSTTVSRNLLSLKLFKLRFYPIINYNVIYAIFLEVVKVLSSIFMRIYLSHLTGHNTVLIKDGKICLIERDIFRFMRIIKEKSGHFASFGLEF